MRLYQPWSIEYLDEKFSQPDPWKYQRSPYEQKKYMRQIDLVRDRLPGARRFLEIGSAEGAMTQIIAGEFKDARITCVEISKNAATRSRERLSPWLDRIELINADIADHAAKLEGTYDVCIWSESVYYIGVQRRMNETYDIISRVVGKIRDAGLLVMANAVDLPEDIPEAAMTERPLINCYYSMISSMASPASRASYSGTKGGRAYSYEIWAFVRQA